MKPVRIRARPRLVKFFSFSLTFQEKEIFERDMAVRFFVLRHSLLLLVLFSATSALPSRPAASRRALNRDWYARRAAADPAARF